MIFSHPDNLARFVSDFQYNRTIVNGLLSTKNPKLDFPDFIVRIIKNKNMKM